MARPPLTPPPAKKANFCGEVVAAARRGERADGAAELAAHHDQRVSSRPAAFRSLRRRGDGVVEGLGAGWAGCRRRRCSECMSQPSLEVIWMKRVPWFGPQHLRATRQALPSAVLP